MRVESELYSNKEKIRNELRKHYLRECGYYLPDDDAMATGCKAFIQGYEYAIAVLGGMRRYEDED